MAEQPEDETMLDNDEDKIEIVPLSEDERRILELYDRLQQLQLEVAVLNASQRPAVVSDNDPGALQAAQNALLDARARYKLRNDAVELVMTANPILKAVHGGTNASPIERDLLPYIERRDKVSISVAKEVSDTTRIRNDLTKVQSETMRVCRNNIDLTSRLFDLAEQLKAKKAVNVDDSQAQGEIRRLEEELRASRRRWRVIKGVASAVVAGSGIDWARDDVLRDIVLDPENED